MVICLERGADLHMAQLMPLPLTVSCFSKIQIGFTFLVPAFPGSPGKRAVKRVCVCGVTTAVQASTVELKHRVQSNICHSLAASITNKLIQHLAGFPTDNCGLCRQFAGLGEMELLCKALVGEERVLVKVLQQTIHTPHRSGFQVTRKQPTITQQNHTTDNKTHRNCMKGDQKVLQLPT